MNGPTLAELRAAVAVVLAAGFKVTPVCLKCRNPWREVEPTSWTCWPCFHAAEADERDEVRP